MMIDTYLTKLRDIIDIRIRDIEEYTPGSFFSYLYKNEKDVEIKNGNRSLCIMVKGKVFYVTHPYNYPKLSLPFASSLFRYRKDFSTNKLLIIEGPKLKVVEHSLDNRVIQVLNTLDENYVIRSKEDKISFLAYFNKNSTFYRMSNTIIDFLLSYDKEVWVDDYAYNIGYYRNSFIPFDLFVEYPFDGDDGFELS